MLDSASSSLLSMISPLLGVLLGYWAFRRNEKSDIAKIASQEATILSEIGYIKSGIDDLKRKQEKTEENYTALITRLVCVEQSTLHAHKRLDELNKP